jgi:predicted transcriptional regulator
LKKFADLYAADDLDTFDAQRKAIQPELPGFKSSAERVTALRQLAGISTQILQMLNALQMADVGTDEGLSAQKSMLLVRYKLSPMIGNETAVKALLNDTETFLLRVKNAQEIHAPRMMEILKKLKESLSGSSILLKGLGQLNQITTLGPPQGHDLASRLENLLNSVERELTGESNLHRSLSYNPPENEIRDIHNKIKEVFENRAAILRGQLEKVIQEKGKDQLKTLVHLIQINKLSEVATNLSPAIIGTIQKILEEARTQVVRSRVLEQVAEQFPAVGREDLDKFITELKTLLEKEFADKTQEGKKIILTFK